jgi:putative RNA 2'-phosphotransferase
MGYGNNPRPSPQGVKRSPRYAPDLGNQFASPSVFRKIISKAMHPKQLSKFLALVLRHQPQKLDLKLDRGGWADTEQLIQNMQSRGMNVDLDAIREVVAPTTNNGSNYQKTANASGLTRGTPSRLTWGSYHRRPCLTLSWYSRPKPAFHPRKSLLPGKRQHVHLSLDQETARQVGQRHGKPIIFTVNTQAMAADGLSFYCSENGVWLTDHVPPKYFIQ